MSESSIAVSIATLDRLTMLRQSLAAFFENTTVPYELFVVDNGSVDGTREYLEAEVAGRDGATVIVNERNRGVSYAVNQGWYRAQRKDYLVKLDDDIVLPKGWAEQMVEICDRIPEVGCAGINFEGVDYPEMTVNGCRIQRKEGILGGACVMMPGRAFERLGYWSEHFPRIGHEDADMGWRVIYGGMWNAYHPDLHRRGAVHLAEDREADGHDPEYVYLKYLAQSTNFRQFVRFWEYYRNIAQTMGRPVPVCMEHTELADSAMRGPGD